MESNPDKKHVWDKVNNWEEELLFLKSIIDKTELVETIKWGGPIYVYNKKNVIGIGGFKNYFAIWFLNGVFLKDEKKRLINAQEDKTKSMRQWRFTSKEEVNEKEVLEYILEAIEIEKQGKIIKPGEQSIVQNGRDIIVAPADIKNVMAWKNGYFRFRNEPIEEVMAKIIRWYNIDVVYTGKVSGEKFNGNISRRKNISEVLNMLSYSNDVKFKVEGRRVTVIQ